MTARQERLTVRPPRERLRDTDTPPGPSDDRADTLVDLATDWLRAEAVSVTQPALLDLVRNAEERAAAYEVSLTAASTDEVQCAWQLAIARQARTEVGSVASRTASRVAELLRFEYRAAREAEMR